MGKQTDYIFRDQIRDNKMLNRSNGKVEFCEDLKKEIMGGEVHRAEVSAVGRNLNE